MGFSIKSFFNPKPRWQGTPEMFLAMVMELQQMNSQEPSIAEVVVLGEIMMKEFEVNLSPFDCLADLAGRAIPDFSRIGTICKDLRALNERLELKQALCRNPHENMDRGENYIPKAYGVF